MSRKTVKDYQLLAQALQMGWVVVLSLLIPLGLGLWLDKRFGTAPLFILVGVVIGILASTVGVVRMAVRLFGEWEKPKNSE